MVTIYSGSDEFMVSGVLPLVVRRSGGGCAAGPGQGSGGVVQRVADVLGGPRGVVRWRRREVGQLYAVSPLGGMSVSSPTPAW
ncbi:hypothetical protein [Actinopolyspora halophila]|uniref:hypothetical protein n=1 Tax=Actinopolyspora halophila TaxID=1850 RepID=UPI0014614BFA|nr:hypothetical protein [Actinopolyspora halophila]